MNRSKVSILGGALLVGALSVSLASPAAAEPTPQPYDIVGGGSDTTMHALNYIADGALVGGVFSAGYNYGALARLVSFDAGLGTIVLKAGEPSITRPNGSGGGKNLLHGTGNNPAANYARSSSGLNDTEKDNGLQLIPFAVDGIKVAVSNNVTSHAPASLTPQQIVGIYEGTYTDWAELGGTAGEIVVLIPQPDSGTGQVFRAQLAAIKGGTVNYRSGIVEVQEHDAGPIENDANAIAPFSTGRAASEPSVRLLDGWSYERALYNVVRQADVSQPWFDAIFGSDGFICGGNGLPLIQAAGFQQLAHPFDGGVCGVPTQDDTTNFTVN